MENEIRDYSFLFNKLNLEENTPYDDSSKKEKDNNARANNANSYNKPPCDYSQGGNNNSKTSISNEMPQSSNNTISEPRSTI